MSISTPAAGPGAPPAIAAFIPKSIVCLREGYGRQFFFNDLFAGGPGWFIYEEMPGRDSRTGLTGRGLEGLADAFLKAFGI